MDPNVTAYIIYLAMMIYIIYWLGKKFHQKGRVFILSLYNGNEAATDAINNLLLLAYYLFNIGYAFLRIRTWNYIGGYTQLTATLSYQIGLLVLILSLTHYFNMFIIYILSRKQKTIFHHKNQIS